MATLFTMHGEIKEVQPKDGKFFSYEELKAFVGGYIEIVPLPSGKSIVVNEEGKINGLGYNQLASREWLNEYPIDKYPNNNDGTIVGDALIVSESELEQ